MDCLILAKDNMLQIALKILERLLVVLADGFRRDARHRRNHGFNLARCDLFPAAAGRNQHLHCANFIDYIDRLVGQFAIIDVACRELDSGFQCIRRIFHLVMLFERGLQAFQDLDRLFNCRLIHIDLLEPAQQRAVFLEVIAEFLVRGRADAADCA